VRGEKRKEIKGSRVRKKHNSASTLESERTDPPEVKFRREESYKKGKDSQVYRLGEYVPGGNSTPPN